AAAANRHDAVLRNRSTEFDCRVVVPHILDAVLLDITDHVVVVVAAQAHVSITVNLERHKDADALIVTKRLFVISIVGPRIVSSAQLRHHHRKPLLASSPKPLNFLKPVHDHAVVKLVPIPNPAIMRSWLIPESSFEVLGVLIRRFAIDPPSEI